MKENLRLYWGAVVVLGMTAQFLLGGFIFAVAQRLWCEAFALGGGVFLVVVFIFAVLTASERK